MKAAASANADGCSFLCSRLHKPGHVDALSLPARGRPPGQDGREGEEAVVVVVQEEALVAGADGLDEDTGLLEPGVEVLTLEDGLAVDLDAVVAVEG